MVTLRGTAGLLSRLHQPLAEDSPTGVLGDWYAKVIVVRPRVLVLCVNERSLLSVVVPLAPASGLLDRFVAAASQRIDQVEVDPSKRRAEIEALIPSRVGRTKRRSVLSSLNHFAFAAQDWLAEDPNGDLEALGRWLCDTPCFPLRTTWPWTEAQMLLEGTG